MASPPCASRSPGIPGVCAATGPEPRTHASPGSRPPSAPGTPGPRVHVAPGTRPQLHLGCGCIRDPLRPVAARARACTGDLGDGEHIDGGWPKGDGDEDAGGCFDAEGDGSSPDKASFRAWSNPWAFLARSTPQIGPEIVSQQPFNRKGRNAPSTGPLGPL
jgi:hypothetical protein